MDVDSHLALLKAQLATLPKPSTQANFFAGFLAILYEKLMNSVGKTGTFKNFQKNIFMIDQIIKNHYDTDRCINDLSDDLAEERAQFFEPFLICFNKEGL